MSIDFTQAYEEPLVTTSLTALDEAARSPCAPSAWTDYTGQEKAKENLSGLYRGGYAAAASRWTMCCSTARRAWARRRWRASSPTRWASISASPPARPSQKPGDLAALLTNLQPGRHSVYR